MPVPSFPAKSRRRRLFVAGRAALALGLVSWMVPPAAPSGAAGEPGLYLVLELVMEPDPPAGREPEAASLRLLYHRPMVLAGTRAAEPEGEAGVPGAGGEILVELEDADGRRVARQVARAERFLRGESAADPRQAPPWPIAAARAVVPRRVFAVRLPARGADRLVASDADRRLELNLAAALAPPPQLVPPAGIAAPVGPRGDPANRLDLLVMGDGYTAADAAAFDADAAALAAALLAVTPWAEYRNYLNVTRLFTPSGESGADHPPYEPGCPGEDRTCCPDPAALADPRAGVFAATAFGGRFCAAGIHRLAVVDTAAVLAAAGAVPDWDLILVVLNDPVYGGSGGALAVVSHHPQAAQIAAHELGHTLGGLADEYEDAYPGYPACSDLPGAGRACEANVTDETARGLVKWDPWIAPETPLPTPEGDPELAAAVGLFEGARYQPAGLFRPGDARCLMRFLGVPFDEICAQELVRVLYRGGWGEPAGGIEGVEPGSEAPPPGEVAVGAEATFRVVPLGPAGGPPARLSWRVDGEVVPEAGGPALRFRPPRPGVYAVEVTVEDATSLVHPEMAGGLLETRRRWTAVAADAGFEDDFEDALLPPDWTFAAGDWEETGGALVGLPAGGRAALAAAVPRFRGAGPGRVEADLELVAGAGAPARAAVLAWASGPGTQVALILDTLGAAALRQREGGATKELVETAVALAPGVLHAVGLEYDGQQIRVWLDGEELFSVPEAFQEVVFGSVGIEVLRGEVRLHRLRVEPWTVSGRPAQATR